MIRDYLEMIEQKRAAAMAEDAVVSLTITVDGELLGLVFQNEAQAKVASPYFTGMLVTTGEKPAAKVFYWKDDCAEYMPAGADRGPGVWNFQGSGGRVLLTVGHSLIAVDERQRRYYVCLQNDAGKENLLYGHALIVVFMLWQRARGRSVIHGAAVGREGEGVLIVARGGKGKSTLSVSCLLGGFDFVSDDYTVLHREEDELIATPLYRTVGLNQDMYRLLQPDMPIVHVDRDRGDKLLLDASACAYATRLRIKALIVPRVDPEAGPALRRTDPGRALIPMIHSTVKQMGFARDQEMVKTLLSLVSGLPVFEFTLGPDIFENRDYLGNALPQLSQY